MKHLHVASPCCLGFFTKNDWVPKVSNSYTNDKRQAKNQVDYEKSRQKDGDSLVVITQLNYKSTNHNALSDYETFYVG